jgi:serine/threonine protein kinase
MTDEEGTIGTIFHDDGMSSGHFGEVVRVTHNGMECALKVSKSRFSMDVSDESSRKNEGKIIGIPSVKEVDIMSRFRHPHLMESIDLLPLKGNRLGIVMPLGQTTLSVIKKEIVPYESKVVIINQLLSAVAFLHYNKVLHLDLKCGNTIFNGDTQDPGSINIKIIDFGLSIEYIDLGYYTKSSMGTKPYMSPELLSKVGVLKSAVDIWAVGIIAFNLFSGKLHIHKDKDRFKNLLIRSFGSNSRQFLTESCKDCPLEMIQLMSECLKIDPEERISACNALKLPVFSGMKTIQPGYMITPNSADTFRTEDGGSGSSSHPSVEPIPELERTVRRFMKKLKKSGCRINTDALFSALDIYHRSYHLCISKYRHILLPTCFLIGAKLSDGNKVRLDIDNIKELIDEDEQKITAEAIVKVELSIVIKLKGVLIGKNLISKCRCLEDMVDVFHMFYSNDYLTTDFDLLIRRLPTRGTNFKTAGVSQFLEYLSEGFFSKKQKRTK